jgi:T5SS/PEP-CTERM-associated repeat protein
VLQIADAAALRLDATPSGQPVRFGNGDELILNAPGTAFGGAITGLAVGDRIEFGNGMTVTSASVVNTNTIVVDFHGSGGASGTYDLTDVRFAAGAGQFFSVGNDTTTGDSFIQAASLAPRTLVWTGAGNTNFANPANWDDTTNNLNPAESAPGSADSAEFGSGSGEIAGSGTAGAVLFGGGGAWQLVSGATLGVTGTVTIGPTEAADLLIGAGSRLVEAGGAVIANTAGAGGSSVNVTGTGSNWQINGTLDVGNAGFGQLSVSQGGTVTAAGLDTGVTAQGAIDLSGPGSELLLTGDGIVADAGSAEMSILNGATVSGTNLTVGSQGTSSGVLTVSDAGSLLTLTGTLYIGTANGVGDLTVGPGATIIATSVRQQQGQVVLEGGLLDANVINVTSGQTNGGYGAAGGTGDLIGNEGTLLAKAGTEASQKVMTVLGTIVGQGIMQIDTGSTMELTGPVLSGSPAVNINNDGTPVAVPSTQTVIFETGTAGALQLDAIGGFAGTIGAYYAGDLLVISGGVLSGLSVSNGDTLTVNDGGGVDRIVFAAPISAGQFTIVGGNTIDVVQCFAEGTLLLTARGPVAVEDLSEGDLLVTGEDAREEPIRWIGRRAVNCIVHPKPEQVWPVRVSRHAFGRDQPSRGLYLSPDHAVFVNDVLVPVKYLLNGTSIAQMRRKTVTYYHVELPHHELILAEGLAVESYLDVGDRSNFENGGGAIALFPNFTSLKWETEGCAPLVVTGPELEAARAMVAKWNTKQRAQW